jgi:CheY-like chemotaxis protein
LSITSKLVSKLGGTISLDSELEKFTEFVVDLPFEGEIVDPICYEEKLKDTTIVILDPLENVTETFSMEDDFMPLCPRLVQAAKLKVLRCSSWPELECKLRACDKTRHYALIVHQDLDEQQRRETIHKLVGQENCVWFTSGTDLSRKHRHFRSLNGIFPSILLDTISKEVANVCMISEPRLGSVTSSKTTESACNICICSMAVTNPSKHNLTNEVSTTKFPSSSPGRKSSTLDGEKPAVKYPPRDLKVLYAEDNIVNQKVLERVLRRLGVNDITIVDNGLKAVEHTENTKYDCIFMDMQMPVMDGLEACKIIVDRDASEKVVFVTAHALSDYKAQADAAGAIDFISKPFNMEKIDTLLKTLEK